MPWKVRAKNNRAPLISICASALARRLSEPGAAHVHLAPNIPPPVLITALQGYLNLEDDEILLAVAGVPKQGGARIGCALTTRRIHWHGTKRNPDGQVPPRSQSLEYAMLPASIAPMGSGPINLGGGRWFGTTGSSSLRTALIDFLAAGRAMARGEPTAQAIAEPELQNARLVWPRVLKAARDARALQSEVRQFESRMMHASRAIVTPVLVLACVLVYAAMVARGVNWMKPDGLELLDWGADFGPNVIIDHQYWRLFTSMFLHFGLFHLAMNMFCLATAGPLVERLFGHFGFAALYVLSGLGGSILSVGLQPMGICAGASGAIFGIFGALLGFLALRHRDVPLSILKPLRAGALTFVVYNTLFSAVVPGISMAAHSGGLATGFLCGLLMTAVAPAGVQGLLVAVKRAAMAGLVALGLSGAGNIGFDWVQAKMMADPEMRSILIAAPAYQAYYNAAEPIFREFDRTDKEVQKIGADLDTKHLSKPAATEALGRLRSRADSLTDRIRAIPVQDPGIQPAKDEIALAQSFQQKLIDALQKFVATDDEKYVTGPDGFQKSVESYYKHHEQAISLANAYMKANDLGAAPDDKGKKP